MEAGKDTGKSHSWVEGAEVEADRWVDTSDPAALDAWGREGSPGPRVTETQGLGEEIDLSASDCQFYHGGAETGSVSNKYSSLQCGVEILFTERAFAIMCVELIKASHVPHCAGIALQHGRRED